MMFTRNRWLNKIQKYIWKKASCNMQFKQYVGLENVVLWNVIYEKTRQFRNWFEAQGWFKNFKGRK